MSIIRFVDRDVYGSDSDYEISPLDAELKYTLKKYLPESLPRNVFIYTLDTQELYHGIGYGLPLKKVYTEEETRKTAVFYFSMLTDPEQTITIYTPLKGFLTKLYVNLGKVSGEDLHIEFYNSTEELASVTIPSGEKFAEVPLEGTVDYEELKVVAKGELSLPQISVMADIIPIRNE